MKELLNKIFERKDLENNESYELFCSLMKGELNDVQIAAFLAALRTKGETPDEIAGAARALREMAKKFPLPDYDVADTCGTGGDGTNTINVSTAVAVVASCMGIKIAKHGNRSVSSRCGSADIFESFGVKLNPPPETARKCLDELNLCFLFAPTYHGGMRYAMPVRKTLGVRTVFNLLGPLVNPAMPAYQVMGVYDPQLCVPVAKTLGLLGVKSAMVVHGGGMDEIAIHDTTKAAIYRDGKVEVMEITPEMAGLPAFPLKDIQGGEPEINKAKLMNLFGGMPETAHEVAVAINAGALAWICGVAKDLKAGAEMAQEVIRSSACMKKIEKLAELTNDN